MTRRMALLLVLLGSLLLIALPIALTAQQAKAAHAVMPFDFWVEDEKLPAGDYVIEHIKSTSYFLFRSTDGKHLATGYTLLLADDACQTGEYKLIFRVEDGKHVLYGGWGPFGSRVQSEESTEPAPSGQNRVEVPVTYR